MVLLHCDCMFLLHLRLEGVGVGEGDSGRVGGDRAGGE